MTPLRGTINGMITPFDPSGNVDTEALAAFNDWQIAGGLRRLIPVGADGVVIVPPFYSTPSDDELHHDRTVAAPKQIPIMVNNPATANVNFRPELVARITDIPGCDDIHEATLEMTRVRTIRRLCDDKMQVFARMLSFELIVEGAIGWVAVASNVALDSIARLFKRVARFGLRFADVPA